MSTPCARFPSRSRCQERSPPRARSPAHAVAFARSQPSARWGRGPRFPDAEPGAGGGGLGRGQGDVGRAGGRPFLLCFYLNLSGGRRLIKSARFQGYDSAVTRRLCAGWRVRRPESVLPRLNVRPGVGGVRSHVGIQQSFLSQSARTATFQQRFDARQKIGLSDARLKLGVKDAREKLLQKDARFRIKGKVQDAREMLNSRKQQGTVTPKPHQVADAREKLSLKRSSPAAFVNPPVGTVTPALKLTKTIQVPQQKAMTPPHAHSAGMRINVVNHHQAKQNLYDLDEDDDIAAPIPSKMKFAVSGSFLHHMAGLSSSKLSMSKAPPLTKVVQNDAYTAPALPSSVRTKALTNMSRTLVNKEDSPKELPPAEPILSPLEGTKMTVNNLHPRVTEEDIVELFCVCGALKRARLVHPGVAEVVFVKKDDAITAYKKYNNRCLDGQPMKCNLHMNGNVITSDQPILLRLSDSPSVKKESELPRRVNSAASSHPPAEVDPDTILKALFKSSGASTTPQPTEFKIKL